MATEASNLYVESEKKPVFDQLVRALSTEGSRARNIDAFLLAVAYGFKLGQSKPLQRKESYIKTSQLTELPSAKALLAAVCLAGRGVSEPPSMNDCYSDAEAYANAGVEALESKLTDFELFRHWLNAEVLSSADTLEPQWPFAPSDELGDS